MKPRTEEEWRQLHENAVMAILAGKCSNYHLWNLYDTTLVKKSISMADYLVEEMKKRESEETTPQQ